MPIRTMVWGSRCTECQVQFFTRPRLIQHLAYDSVLCRRTFMEGEPLALDPLVVKELDKRDSAMAKANKRAGLPVRHAFMPAMP